VFIRGYQGSLTNSWGNPDTNRFRSSAACLERYLNGASVVNMSHSPCAAWSNEILFPSGDHLAKCFARAVESTAERPNRLHSRGKSRNQFRRDWSRTRFSFRRGTSAARRRKLNCSSDCAATSCQRPRQIPRNFFRREPCEIKSVVRLANNSDKY